jgi:hypothetical protein
MGTCPTPKPAGPPFGLFRKRLSRLLRDPTLDRPDCAIEGRLKVPPIVAVESRSDDAQAQRKSRGTVLHAVAQSDAHRGLRRGLPFAVSTEVVAVFRLGWSPNRPPDKPTVRLFKRRGPRPSQMHGRAGNIRRIIGKSPRCPRPQGLGPQLARRLVLADSFYSPRVARQRGSIRRLHEVRRGEKRCLSFLRLLTWR